MSDGRKTKRSSDASSNNRSRKSHQRFWNDMVDELRTELNLIDKAIRVLMRLARSHERRLSSKR